MTAALEERLPEAEPLDRRRMNLVFVTILVGMLLAALDQTIVSTALPTIVGDLGGAGHLSWVVSSYLLADTIATVLAGKFGDQFGRKLLFQVSAAVFVVASAMCGLVSEHELADRLAGRPGLRRRLPDGDRDRRHRRHHPAARARQVPRRAGCGLRGHDGARPVAGRPAHRPPVLAVDLLHQPARRDRGHRARRVHHAVHQARGRPSIDYLGIVFVSLGAAGLTLALSWGGTQYPWTSPTIVWMVVGSLVSLIVFVLVERRATDPILPLRLFTSSVFNVCVVLAFIVGFAMLGAMTFLPTYLQYVHGSSATESGLQTLPMVLGLLTMSLVSGTVVGRTGRYKIFPVVGGAVMALGLYLLSRLGVDTPYWQMAVAMLVLGLGIGSSMQVLTIVVQSTVGLRGPRRRDVRRDVLPHPRQLVRRGRVRHHLRQRAQRHAAGRRGGLARRGSRRGVDT